MSRFSTVVVLVVLVISRADRAAAQGPPLSLPNPSQAASVSQRIGLTDVAVTYHRPAVNKRTIWGELVPYGEVWRAGANENTVLALSSDATIGGHAVPAGSYGLHMIPTAKDWTVILSRESTAWGSFFYDPKLDAARFTVQPQSATFQEHLSYAFENPSDRGVTLVLRWEKLAIPLSIAVDTPAVVTASLRRELHGLPGFFWQRLAQAAAWCARHDVNLDEAATWADRAVAQNRNFTTLRAKALILEKKGDTAGAATLREQALTRATEADMNQYGYELLQQGRVDQAIEVFRTNVDKYADSWNVHDSLGEALAIKGNKKEAAQHYSKALSMAPDDTNRKRIQSLLAGLGATK